jgi:hypothetical protein
MPRAAKRSRDSRPANRGNYNKVHAIDPWRPVGIFISYAHEDADIVQAFSKAFRSLNEKTYKHIDVFIDTNSLKSGEIFDLKIRESLRNSEYLIIIYTGLLKQSHSYTGLELGYFLQLIDADLSRDGQTCRKIISVYFDEGPPEAAAYIEGIDLRIDRDELSQPRSDYVASIAQTLVENGGGNDPLVRLFQEIARMAESRLPPSASPNRDPNEADKDRTERFQTILAKIVPDIRGDVFDCLSRRVARRRVEQRLLKFELPKSTTEPIRGDDKIPNIARITEQGDAFDIFGVGSADSDEGITWQQFKQSVADQLKQTSSPLISAIERAFVSAVSPIIEIDNEQIIRSPRDNRVYRVIVTRQYDYYDGRKILHMYFIETLRRAYLGNNRTSTILAFVNLAAKYRFIFLERESELSVESFILERNPQILQDKVRQVIRQLVLIEDEARVLNIDGPAAFYTYYGEMDVSELKVLNDEWCQTRKALMDDAEVVMHADSSNEGFGEFVKSWLDTLSKFVKVSKRMNTMITQKALDNLRSSFHE